MKRYDGKYAEGFAFNTGDREIAFGKNSRVADENYAIENMAAGNDFVLAGEFSAGDIGFYSIGHKTSLTIADEGRINSNIGVAMTGRDQSITNNGEIDAEIGVIVTGENADVANHGVVSGYYGLVLQDADGGRIVNGRDGEVHGLIGITVSDASETQQSKTLNLGSITSPAFAFVSADGSDKLTNRGLIDGVIGLGGGNDVFDGRHGTTIGPVSGGAGDDKYVIDDAALRLLEDTVGGYDTVISSVNFQLPDNFEKLVLTGRRDLFGRGTADDNTLVGNSGDNRLYGGYGSDVLAGGRGQDALFGGIDEDLFVFRTGDGRDTIQDFQDGVDHLALNNWKGLSDEELLSHAGQKNGDLIISFKGDQLIIENFTKAQFDPGDFQG